VPRETLDEGVLATHTRSEEPFFAAYRAWSVKIGKSGAPLPGGRPHLSEEQCGAGSSFRRTIPLERAANRLSLSAVRTNT